MSIFKKIKESFESKKNIVRVQKNKENPYVMINKSCLNDSNLSWAAKGLHSYLLSLPDDWEIYVNELVKHTSAGRDHTYRVINELLKHGYMQKTQYRCEGKVLGLNYTVFEVSTGEDNTKAKISNVTLNNNGEIVDISSIEPNTESTETDKPDTDYTTLLNNNNNELITKPNNNSVVVVSEKETQLLEMYKSFKIEKRVMPQTKTLLKQYIDKFDLDVFEQVFISASEESVKKKYAYMKKVFEELTKKNVRNLEDYDQDNEKYRANKESKKAISTKEPRQVKTRFHNITDRTKNYTPEELEKLLKENQARKEAKKQAEEAAARRSTNKFNNFDQTFDKYSEEELNDIIAKSQEAKFGNVEVAIKVTEEIANKCIIDPKFFERLNDASKDAVRLYMSDRIFVPLHISCR